MKNIILLNNEEILTRQYLFDEEFFALSLINSSYFAKGEKYELLRPSNLNKKSCNKIITEKLRHIGIITSEYKDATDTNS